MLAETVAPPSAEVMSKSLPGVATPGYAPQPLRG